MRLDWKSIRVECLGFAAVVATLPISEPALHSLYTIAPGRFTLFMPAYLTSALVAALVTALILIARSLVSGCRLQAKTTGKHHGSADPSPRGRRDSLPIASQESPSIPSTDGANRNHSPKELSARAFIETWWSPAILVGCALVGLAGLWLPLWIDLPPVVLVILGSIAGIGSALTLTAWGRLYRARCRGNVLLNLALSSALGGLLLNTLGTMPPIAACIIFVILQLVAIGVPVALGIAHTPPATLPYSDPNQRPTGGTHVFAVLVPLAGIALYAASFHLLGMHGTLFLYLSFMLGAIAVGVIGAAILLWQGERLPRRVTGGVVPLIAGLAALAIIVSLSGGAQAVPGRIALMVFIALVILTSLASLIDASDTPFRNAAIPLAVAIFAAASLIGLQLQMHLSSNTNARALLVLAILYLGCVCLREVMAPSQETALPPLPRVLAAMRPQSQTGPPPQTSVPSFSPVSPVATRSRPVKPRLHGYWPRDVRGRRLPSGSLSRRVRRAAMPTRPTKRSAFRQRKSSWPSSRTTRSSLKTIDNRLSTGSVPAQYRLSTGSVPSHCPIATHPRCA